MCLFVFSAAEERFQQGGALAAAAPNRPRRRPPGIYYTRPVRARCADGPTHLGILMHAWGKDCPPSSDDPTQLGMWSPSTTVAQFTSGRGQMPGRAQMAQLTSEIWSALYNFQINGPTHLGNVAAIPGPGRRGAGPTAGEGAAVPLASPPPVSPFTFLLASRWPFPAPPAELFTTFHCLFSTFH